jgi:hypothetical protein
MNHEAGRSAGKSDAGSRVGWGYAVWGCVGIVVAIPEIWSAVSQPGFRTISETVGHLERLWNPTAMLVVGLVAIALTNVVRFSLPGSKRRIKQVRGREVGHTAAGRYAWTPTEIDERSPLSALYIPIAIAAIAVPSALVASQSSDPWLLGYVLYGLIATFAVAIPSVLAFALKREVPFATLFQTVADLERRSHLIATGIIAGLTILFVHLALYPWPDIFRHNPHFGAP